MKLKDLAEPFAPEAVHWRVGNTNQKAVARDTGKKDARPTKGMALAYIDARDVMGRLDDVVGAESWSDTYQVFGPRVICTLSIRCGDQWVAKSDGAGDTDYEGNKGAISDAFKRAGVKWGIGRYLYDIDAPWVPLDQYGRIDRGAQPQLDALLQPKDAHPAHEKAQDIKDAMYASANLEELKETWTVNWEHTKVMPEYLQNMLQDTKEEIKRTLGA